MTEAIEVFQDMSLVGDVAHRPILREALIAAAAAPWHADLRRSEQVARDSTGSQDVLLFRCDATATHPAAGLTLWGNEQGYYVPNIVPLEIGKLSYAHYNAILLEFVDRIARPVAARHGFEIVLSAPNQAIEDWLSPDAAVKLKRFSALANKSTGASHPLDGRRWFDFIVAVHRTGDDLGPDRLARWLCEVEDWDEDTAHRLAGDFENALSLLKHYDEN